MTLREIINPWGALKEAKRQLAALQRAYDRLTDRDERGRFTKSERD